MRLWTLHPKLLDQKGLGGLWSEGLLALKVLRGETTAYANHPQMQRFQKHPKPLEALQAFLTTVQREGLMREYKYFSGAFKKCSHLYVQPILVNSGQVMFELDHLIKKLYDRSGVPQRELEALRNYPFFIPLNPIFQLREVNELEPWEKENKNALIS